MTIQLIHGDCLAVMPTLSGIDAVISDPPYGDNHDTDYTRFSGGINATRSTYAPIAGDAQEFDPLPFLRFNRVVLFGANRYSHRLPCGTLLIWDKRTPMGSKNVMSDAEVAWMNHGRGVYIYTHTWDGFNRASERGQKFHPTQKPVALMKWVIQQCKLPAGATILDPYMGSGATGLAALDLGYNFVGVEINTVYFEIAQRRIAEAQLQPRMDLQPRRELA